MVEAGAASMVSRMAIQLTVAFTIVGVGLLYLGIAIADASVLMKVIWASTLSLAVAVTFLIIWAMAMDSVKQQEWENKQRPGK